MAKPIVVKAQKELYQLAGRIRNISFDKVEKKSLFKLFLPSVSKHAEFDRHLKQYTNQFFEEIKVAQDLASLFTAVSRLEVGCSKIINTLLADINKKETLGNLSPQFAAISAIETSLNELSICLSMYLRDNFEEIIKELNMRNQVALAKNLTTIHAGFRNISDDVIKNLQSPNHAKYAEWKEQFDVGAASVKSLMLTALLKGSCFPSVTLLISDLAENICDELGNWRGFAIQIGLSSFSAIGVEAELQCILPAVSEDEEPLSALNSRVPASSLRAPGGVSTFVISASATMDEMNDIREADVFAQVSARIADPMGKSLLLPLMEKAIYLDTKNSLQYATNTVVLLHEWIHVAHNQQGRNLKSQKLSDSEQSLWGNMEEYVTLREGPYNESALLEHFGANPRQAYKSTISAELAAYPLLELERAIKPQIMAERLEVVIDDTLKPLKESLAKVAQAKTGLDLVEFRQARSHQGP